MTWAATFSVVLPPRGENWGRTRTGEHRVGGIIVVHPYRGEIEEVTAERIGLIHVTDVPDGVDRENAKVSMESPWMDNESRAWWVDPQMLPTKVRGSLLSDRQVSVSWVEFRAALRNLPELRGATAEDFSKAVR